MQVLTSAPTALTHTFVAAQLGSYASHGGWQHIFPTKVSFEILESGFVIVVY